MFNKKLLSSIDLGKYKKKNPYKKDIILDPMGQWKHPGKNTRIPSSSITMKGVNYPVLGVSNTGQKQMMQPGKEYNFPGADYVDEYPQMKRGGLIKAQTGIATYQDSLDVYNNALQQQAYYDKLKPYFNKVDFDRNSSISLSDAKRAEKETSNHTPQPYWTPQDKANFQKTKNIIKANKDKNIAYITDIITGALDPNAPALRYDGRIKPQGIKNYDPYTPKYTSKEQEIIDKIRKKYGDNLEIYDGKSTSTWLTKKDAIEKGKKLGYTEKEITGILYKAKKDSESRGKLKGFYTTIPYYDPLAVKPGKLLTDDEIKKRVKLYGTTGIPTDRLKKLGLNNSQPPKTNTTTPPKTNTPTVVKSPCSNPITTVINNVPEKAPFGKKLVGTDEETLPVTGKKCEYVKTINPIYEDIKIEPIEIQKFPVRIDNVPLQPLQMHDYTLPDPIETPQYTLDPYTAYRLSLDVQLPQNKIAALFDKGVIDSKGHIALGKRNKTRLIPRMVQKLTGYDPAYFEGYEDEEGNFVPGELDYGNATGSEMEFRGAASLRDFINQQKYKKEYEEYDKKLDTWLEQYEQSKKKQEQGQAFKKGGAKKKYTSDIINSTNYLFAEHPLFKKKKQSKKRIYDPKAKYYQPGGQITYNQLPKNYQDALKNFTYPEVVDSSEETGYDAAMGVIKQNPNDPIANVNNPWWMEHELMHHLQNQAGAMSTYGTVGQRPNPYVASDEAIGSYYDRRGAEFDIELNKIFEQNPNISEEEAYALAEENLYRNPTSVEGEARNYEGYIEAGNPSIFNKKAKYYQFGGLTRFINRAGKTLKLPPAILNESNILPTISNLKPASSISKDLKIGPGVKGLLADPRYRIGREDGFPVIEYDFPSASIRQLGDYKYQPYSEGWWAEHDMKTALEQPQWVPGKEDFFTDQEIVDLVKQQKDYNESLAAFNEMHPESPGMEIMRTLSGDTSRDELFANLFPNASIPNFRSKILSPEQTAALNRIELQNKSFQNKAGLSNPALKTLGVGQDILPTQYNDLLTFYNKGIKYLKTAPAKDVVMEIRGLPELKGVDIKNASPLQLETWRDKIVKKMEKQAIERWKKDRGDKLTGLDAYNKMLNQSGSRNKYGGQLSKAKYGHSIGNLIRKQDGGITKLSPEEEIEFQKFYATLPENLQTDDATYDIRGYWDSEGRPEKFNYHQPKERDGYYHAYSINQNTGEYLKSPAHETFQHAVDEDRKIGYRPIPNVYGRNIATYNESIADPEQQSFLRNMIGAPSYIELELDDNQIKEYRKGGYIVEDISVPSLTRMQPGGLIETATKLLKQATPGNKVRSLIYSGINPAGYGLKTKLLNFPKELSLTKAANETRPFRVGMSLQNPKNLSKFLLKNNMANSDWDALSDFEKMQMMPKKQVDKAVDVGRRRLDAFAVGLKQPQEYGTLEQVGDNTFRMKDISYDPEYFSELYTDILAKNMLDKSGVYLGEDPLVIIAKQHYDRTMHPHLRGLLDIEDQTQLGKDAIAKLSKMTRSQIDKLLYRPEINFEPWKQNRVVELSKINQDPNFKYSIYDDDQFGVMGGFRWDLADTPEGMLWQANDTWDLNPWQQRGETRVDTDPFIKKLLTEHYRKPLQHLEALSLVGGKPFDIQNNFLIQPGTFKTIKQYQNGGEYGLGDEVDEATMKQLKELGFTFEKIK